MDSGKGIDFSATSDGSGTTTSELFDDYEEGTFTPTVAPTSGTFTTLTYTTQTGEYTKVGNICYIQLRVAINAFTVGSGTGLRIGGLPFASAGSTGGLSIGLASGWTSNPHNCRAEAGSSTLILLDKTAFDADTAPMQETDIAAGAIVHISGFYKT